MSNINIRDRFFEAYSYINSSIYSNANKSDAMWADIRLLVGGVLKFSFVDKTYGTSIEEGLGFGRVPFKTYNNPDPRTAGYDVSMPTLYAYRDINQPNPKKQFVSLFLLLPDGRVIDLAERGGGGGGDGVKSITAEGTQVFPTPDGVKTISIDSDNEAIIISSTASLHTIKIGFDKLKALAQFVSSNLDNGLLIDGSGNLKIALSNDPDNALSLRQDGLFAIKGGSPSSGADYSYSNSVYISPNGNDATATGKYDKPFAKLNSALKSVSDAEDDFVYIRTKNDEQFASPILDNILIDNKKIVVHLPYTSFNSNFNISPKASYSSTAENEEVNIHLERLQGSINLILPPIQLGIQLDKLDINIYISVYKATSVTNLLNVICSVVEAKYKRVSINIHISSFDENLVATFPVYAALVAANENQSSTHVDINLKIGSMLGGSTYSQITKKLFYAGNAVSHFSLSMLSDFISNVYENPALNKDTEQFNDTTITVKKKLSVTQNLNIPNVTAPISTEYNVGDIFYDKDSDKFFGRNEKAFIALDSQPSSSGSAGIDTINGIAPDANKDFAVDEGNTEAIQVSATSAGIALDLDYTKLVSTEANNSIKLATTDGKLFSDGSKALTDVVKLINAIKPTTDGKMYITAGQLQNIAVGSGLAPNTITLDVEVNGLISGDAGNALKKSTTDNKLFVSTSSISSDGIKTINSITPDSNQDFKIDNSLDSSVVFAASQSTSSIRAKLNYPNMVSKQDGNTIQALQDGLYSVVAPAKDGVQFINGLVPDQDGKLQISSSLDGVIQYTPNQSSFSINTAVNVSSMISPDTSNTIKAINNKLYSAGGGGSSDTYLYYVFLDTVNGSDTNSGLTKRASVKTLIRAIEIANTTTSAPRVKIVNPDTTAYMTTITEDLTTAPVNKNVEIDLANTELFNTTGFTINVSSGNRYHFKGLNGTNITFRHAISGEFITLSTDFLTQSRLDFFGRTQLYVVANVEVIDATSVVFNAVGSTTNIISLNSKMTISQYSGDNLVKGFDDTKSNISIEAGE